MNKKILSLIALTGTLVIGSSLFVNSEKDLFSFAFEDPETCEHKAGRYYEFKNPTETEAGHGKFYSCCSCQSSWLNKPAIGNFSRKAEESEMSGGLAKGHIAYLPSLQEYRFNRLDLDLTLDANEDAVVDEDAYKTIECGIDRSFIKHFYIDGKTDKEYWSGYTNGVANLHRLSGNHKTSLVLTNGFSYDNDALIVSKVINNEAELREMNKIAYAVANKSDSKRDGYFELANDINLKKIENTTDFNWSNKEAMAVNSTSADSNSTDGFVGVFDGLGHTIKNFCPESGGQTFNDYGKDIGNGFISNLKAPGTLKNICFTDVRFNFTKTSIIGQGNGTLENVYIQILKFEGKAFITPLFVYNGYSGAVPTIKNTVIDYCKYNNVAASIPDGRSNTSFALGGNKNAEFPNLENFFVLTNTSTCNTKVPKWFGFCFGMKTEANYTQYGREAASASSYDLITYSEFTTKYKDKEYLFSLGSSNYDSGLCAAFRDEAASLYETWNSIFTGTSQVQTLFKNVGF